MSRSLKFLASTRALLRAIRDHVTSKSGNKQWHNHAVSVIRAASNNVGSDAELERKNEKLMEAMTFLIGNIAQHKALLASYNIGIDQDDRNKKMIAATAKRVGFSLDRLPPSV